MLPDMKNRFIYALGFCAAILASCGEMDEIHRDFYEDGEIIYPGKADSLKAYPGRYRLGLSWLILADPKATRAKIFWNNRQDSLEMDMVRTSHTDTVEVMFENLEEKAYTFEVFTFDNAGNQSVRSEVLGIVYGDVYEQTLLRHTIRSLAVVKGKLAIEWMDPEEGVVGDEIRYVDKNGVSQQVFAPATADSTWLPGFVPGQSFEFRTLFLPDSLAIDTFRTGFGSMQVDSSLFDRPEVELDKNKFELHVLPTDTYEAYSNEDRKSVVKGKSVSESGML